MGAVTTKRKSNAGKNVFVFFLVFIILEMLIIFGISKVFKNKDVTPSILGYSIFMTKEDLYKDGVNGMEVAVPKNVLVIASNGLHDLDGKIGTAVLCEEVEDVGTGVFYLASVDALPDPDQTGVIYTVANGSKYYTVRSSNLVGSTTSYYKTAGTVINFVTKKFGMIVCAVVPLFLMVFLELIIAIATHSSDDDDYDDEDEEEEEEHKDVKLDDFLFGGQNEAEQIARQRKQQNRKGGAPVKPSKTVDFDDFAPPKRQQKPQAQQANKPQQPQARPQQPQQARSQAAQTRPQQPQQARPQQNVEPQTARFDKPQAATAQQARNIQPAPAQTAPPPMPARAQAAPVQQAAPAPQAAVGETPAPAPKPRKRKRLSSVSAADDNANASLEELMKLMEEEQNKLKNQMK